MTLLTHSLAITSVLLLLSTPTLSASTLSAPALAASPEVLVYLTSDETQIQGMALVLSAQMLQQNAKVQLLLCDDAADLALTHTQSEKLKPFNKSPAELLDDLIQQGVQVEVCALYLPNKTGDKTLKVGVGTAKPPQIAAKMLNDKVKTFSF